MADFDFYFISWLIFQLVFISLMTAVSRKCIFIFPPRRKQKCICSKCIFIDKHEHFDSKCFSFLSLFDAKGSANAMSFGQALCLCEKEKIVCVDVSMLLKAFMFWARN